MYSNPFGPDAPRPFLQVLFAPQIDIQVVGALFL